MQPGISSTHPGTILISQEVSIPRESLRTLTKNSSYLPGSPQGEPSGETSPRSKELGYLTTQCWTQGPNHLQSLSCPQTVAPGGDLVLRLGSLWKAGTYTGGVFSKLDFENGLAEKMLQTQSPRVICCPAFLPLLLCPSACSIPCP